MLGQPPALNGTHAINVIAHADQSLMGGVDAGTTTTDLHEPERIDGAGHRGKIAHSEESFGQSSFGADWSLGITLEDLLGHPRQIFLARLYDVRIHAVHRGGVATEDKGALAQAALDLLLQVFGQPLSPVTLSPAILPDL